MESLTLFQHIFNKGIGPLTQKELHELFSDNAFPLDVDLLLLVITGAEIVGIDQHLEYNDEE